MHAVRRKASYEYMLYIGRVTQAASIIGVQSAIFWFTITAVLKKYTRFSTPDMKLIPIQGEKNDFKIEITDCAF